MKILYHFILLFSIIVICSFKTLAQTVYGNEWIDVNKTYYKIKLAENGIYRLSFEELKSAGFTPTNVNGAHLKLINFGKEQAIYVNDDDFGPGDFIEFYGEKNTIGLDSLMFADWKTDLFNPEYSLINDTNAYFLTLAPETNSLRFRNVLPDFTNNILSPFPYYLHEEKIVFNSTYFKNVDGDIRYSNVEPSEGYGDELRQLSNTSLPTSLFVNTGPSPILSFRTGHNNHLSKLEISFNNVLKETLFINSKKTAAYKYILDKSEIGATNTLTIKNTNTANDRHRLAFASLLYPRSLDFNNKFSFQFLMDASSEKRYLEITSFKDNGKPVFLYDIVSNIRYSTKSESSKIKAIIDPSLKNTKYVLTNQDDGYLKVSGISQFKPLSYANKDQSFIIISHKFLQTSTPNYVQAYADYRSSIKGGSYKTDILDIEDIYNHFGFGIDRHFMSIKQLSYYIRDHWPKAEFVFIIGKGVEYNYVRKTNDVINNTNKSFFIPTYGYTGSDNMLFSEANFPDPVFAVGRLAATKPEDVSIYLDKIKQYDDAKFSPQTIEDKYWMKRVMHLGGGGTVFEQGAIKGGLSNMEYILETSKIGADVRTFYKTSTDVLQSAKIEEIKSLINTGISALTFFGHSAPGTWDFNVEDPSKFENFGKYPIINSLGCYSGNIHSTSKGLSERFVITKDKGSIAFLASSGTAFIGQLSNYGYKFYNKLGNENHDESIGLILKSIYHENRNLGFAEYAFNQQQTFHGDPAIKLYSFDGPDYIFDLKSFKTDPVAPNSSNERININFDIVNLGSGKEDSLDLVFYHRLASNKIVDTIRVTVAAPFSKSSYSINIKGQGINGLGKNTVLGSIDPSNKIKELPLPGAENNNDIGVDGFSFYIYDNSAFPIYPAEFAIINDLDKLVLKASTTNSAIPISKYFFEVDTTELFHSPLVQKSTVTGFGGVISYKPNLVKLPNSVYYWRVIADSTAEFKTAWQNSSFIYLPGESEGWNQSHFFQFKKDAYKSLTLNEDRKFNFGEIEHAVRLRNKFYEESDRPGYFYNFVLFRSIFSAWEFMKSGIGIVVNTKNESSFFSFKNPSGGSFGAENPTGGNLDIFPFKTDNFESRKNLIEFIEKQIKEDFYINLFTIIPNEFADLKVEDWAADSIILGKNLFSVLEKLGANKIRTIQQYGSVPYIFQAHNGLEGVLAEEISPTKDGIIDVNSILRAKSTRGSIKSTKIGPAAAWKEIDIKYSNVINGIDSAFVNVYGINAIGEEELLYEKLISKTILNISPSMYKYLKIESFTSDKTDKTSAQLDYWRVIFEKLPEAALSPNLTYQFHKDTLQEGEKLSMKLAIENIHKIAMDSLLMHYTVINDKNVETKLIKRIAPLKATELGLVDFSYETKGNLGMNQLIIEMNPNEDQPEAIHANNFFIKSFYVEKDKRNPLLDVYFDGVKILDGDIVSPKPEIKITLLDDNTFLTINDPSLFTIRLDTGRNEFVEIPYNDSRLKFIPPSAQDKNATMVFTPSLKTGDYKLEVQATDASGNKSGINDKQINFRVIEEKTVSNVFNYPNPFSNSTQFVFTLTGEEMPETMTISIYTLSGKVVKEITKQELGLLRIGTNRTEYKWDGTDEFGQKLGNGVYLYKVNIRKADGGRYDALNHTKTDDLFTNGFGKMVILR